MKPNQTVSAERLSELAIVPRFARLSTAALDDAVRNGVFLGCAEPSRTPCFFNPELPVNPHVLIVGMSGSGKTYLTRSLVLKLYSVLECQLVLIDFTGEYREFAAFTSCRKYGQDAKEALRAGERAFVYADLSAAKEKQKVRLGKEIVATLTEIMRGRGLRLGPRLFIVLDEAWKLLHDDSGLEIIIREGRKYRVGLILASQLFGDLEGEICTNIATFFTFRMQDAGSLARLKESYEASEEEIKSIQNLNVGSCCVVQLYKNRVRGFVKIERISGFTVPMRVAVDVGEGFMEVDFERLERVVRALAHKEPGALLTKIHAEKNVELGPLIVGLLDLGAESEAILNALRGMGISDELLADAFAYAMMVRIHEAK